MNTKLPLGCLIFRFSDCLFGIEAAKKAAKKHKLHCCKVDNHNFEFFPSTYLGTGDLFLYLQEKMAL
jgi:hypothetical protein